MRPIGIPTFEDKVLQKAVTMVLEAIYLGDATKGSGCDGMCNCMIRVVEADPRARKTVSDQFMRSGR